MAASVLEVVITGDATRLTVALNQGAASAKAFESQANRVGATAKSALGNLVPLGAAAAGVAVAAFAKQSVDAAVDFDRSFTQIAALTNTTSDQLGVMKQRVLDLAGETAQAPNDLAKAAYFLASAGLSASQQMEALDASAKGAAVGLGDAGDLARITANALNVFSDNGLQATDVMDTLAAAVREGSAEPDEFASALGRVLPIADKAGISFQQVAASLATMSNAGLDVNEGVTALRGTLQSLVAPTTQTQDALASIGLTVDDVVNSLQQNGLIATLRLLDQEAKANTQSTGEYNIVMRELVPNVRALTGVFNLTGQEAEKVDAIFRSVVNSTGDLQKAWDETSRSDAFQLKKAFNDVSIAGQELATAVLPIIASAAKFAADNARTLFVVLAGYTALRFLRPLLQGIAAATTELAGAEALAASAAAPNQFRLAGATANVTQFIRGTQGASSSVTMLTSDLTGAAGATARFGNSIGSSGLPQIAALTLALQGANDEIQGFRENGLAGAIDAVTQSLSGTLGQIFTGGVAIDAGPSLTEIQNLDAALAQMQDAFDAAGLTADQESQVIHDALASVQFDPRSDVEGFVAAVQSGLDAIAKQGDAAAQTAAQTHEVVAAQQAATESSRTWQQGMEALTAQLDGLSTIGIDVTSFLSDFKTKLQDSEDPMATFAEGLGTIQSAAQQWRDATASSITDVGGVLSTLANDSNVTASQIHSAFVQAAKDARSFTSDLVTIGKTGGQAGKDLANALLQMGPSAAGLASVVAGSGEAMRKQLVGDFGDILAAGKSGASQLQNALVPVLGDIKTILLAIAKKWGVDVQLQDHASGGITNIQNKLGALTAHEYNVIIHTKAGSPWPDEALQQRLIDPAKAMGFQRIGGRWTLPLDVAAHSDVAFPDGSGRTGSTSVTHYLNRLVQVEVDNRGILMDIRHALRDGGGGTGGGGHGGTGTGGGGGVTGGIRSLSDMAAQVVRIVDRFATAKEGVGVVRHVAQAGLDTGFIKHAASQVADELGNKAARQYLSLLTALDKQTKANMADRKKAIDAAVNAMNHIAQQAIDARREAFIARMEFATKNVPRLPAGHTRIDPNLHNRPPALRLDRKHMDDQLAYQQDYGNGY